MSLDFVEFRRIIEEYYSKPRPDPFLEWFCSHDRESELRTSFERVLVILVDARFDQRALGKGLKKFLLKDS